MDKGAWQATVHGIAESGHDFAFALHSLKEATTALRVGIRNISLWDFL